MSKQTEFSLSFNNNRLELQQTGDDAPGPIYVDFLAGKIGYRHAHPGKELLAKAIGIKANYHPSVIDATAGLGRDAFMLACWGCKVIMLERSPTIAALLQDGLTRALADVELAKKLALTLINTDAQHYFSQLKPENFPDAIYLDPMHPPRVKSALVKKEMRIIRDVVGEEKDADNLLVTALKYARRRVVVKRPRLAAPLANLNPNYSITGKQQRFDVYLSEHAKAK
jgi:16S rRNA (guanine1516-N2)-methyltransferase